MRCSPYKVPVTKCLLALAGVAALFVSAQASATLINFENANSAYGLNDNDQVTTQYQSVGGVTFAGAYLEHTGAADRNPQGFSTGQGQPGDTQSSSLPSGTPGLGNWFLRTSGQLANRGPNGQFGNGIFTKILYDNLVTGASGQIWDIDGIGKNATEQWQVLAFNGTNLVGMDTSPVGDSSGLGSLNALPWTFSLGSAIGFDRIEFKFIGTKSSGIGLAFDNFNATSAQLVSVPAPSSSILLLGFGLGLLGLGLVARRRPRISSSAN